MDATTTAFCFRSKLLALGTVLTCAAFALGAPRSACASETVTGPAAVAEETPVQGPELPPHLAPPPEDNSRMTRAERRRYGWARIGGSTAMALGASAFAFGLASEITMDDGIPSFITGGIETSMFIAATPIAFAGGRSSRRLTGVRGARGLRIASWLLYGAGMAELPVLFGWGVFVDPGNTRIPDGYVIAHASLLLTATALMVGDAFVTHRQAMQVRAFHEGKRPRVANLGFSARPQGRDGVTFSLSGRF